MITTDDYIKFVSNPILPAENKDEDLWFLFKDKMIGKNNQVKNCFSVFISR